jgi:hypothetical protein
LIWMGGDPAVLGSNFWFARKTGSYCLSLGVPVRDGSVPNIVSGHALS